MCNKKSRFTPNVNDGTQSFEELIGVIEEHRHHERVAMKHWLGRVDAALRRAHKFAEFDSWEERYYYDGWVFIGRLRDEFDAY